MKPFFNLLRSKLQLANTPLWRRLFMFSALGTAFLMTMVLLSGEAERGERKRDSTTTQTFLREQETWLANPVETSEFLGKLEAGKLKEVAVSARGTMLLFTDRDGKRASTKLVPCGENCTNPIAERLSTESVKQGFTLAVVSVDPRSGAQKTLDVIAGFLTFLITMLPVLLIVGILIYQLRGGGTAKPTLASRPDVRFSDVIGADSAKKALKRVQAFMLDPSAYTALGASPPRGVLLDGPPGTGKTLLAKALAGECGASFIAVDGSYFTSMFFGTGVNKVKDLFKKARACAPCIIFIDEIDGLGARGRSRTTSAGEQEQSRIINRMLVELDGFDSSDNVIVVAATNHVDLVDEALRRKGRFDYIVRTELPNQSQREQLFAHYIGKLRALPGHVEVASPDDAQDLAETLQAIGRMSVGMSPADIAATVNVAAAYAAEAKEQRVTRARLIQAVQTHQMGGEVTSTNEIITDTTRERLGYHEGGHALVGHVLAAGSISHMSVESRERSLGVTFMTRHTEEPLYNERELHVRLSMLLAGREAELMVYDNTSSGAADDLKRATELAINMVANLGFGSNIGLLSLDGVPEGLRSPTLQQLILTEARQFLEAARAECRAMLEANRDVLDELAREVVSAGNISGAELQAILGRARRPVTGPVAPAHAQQPSWWANPRSENPELSAA